MADGGAEGDEAELGLDLNKTKKKKKKKARCSALLPSGDAHCCLVGHVQIYNYDLKAADQQ